MRIVRTQLAAVLLCVAFGTSVSCATFLDLLPKVVATVADAAMILDEIEHFVDALFSVQPNPELQSKVSRQISVCRQSLNVALRMTTGADELSRGFVDAAFNDFRQSYAELLLLVKPLGVVQTAEDIRLLGISGGLLVVPEPMALSL